MQIVAGGVRERGGAVLCGRGFLCGEVLAKEGRRGQKSFRAPKSFPGLRPADPPCMPMLCVPFWAGAAHVMQFGPVGIADGADQMMAPRDEEYDAPAERHP